MEEALSEGIYRERALKAWENSELELARYNWSMAISLNRNSENYYGRALVLMGLKEYRRALDDLFQSLGLNPSEPMEVYFMIANCYKRIIDDCGSDQAIEALEEACKYFEGALELFPGRLFLEKNLEDFKAQMIQAKRKWFKFKPNSNLIGFPHPLFHSRLARLSEGEDEE